MTPDAAIQQAFLYIAVPILGLACVLAAVAGKMRVLGLAILAMLVGAGMVYVPAAALQGAGTKVATAFLTFFGL